MSITRYGAERPGRKVARVALHKSDSGEDLPAVDVKLSPAFVVNLEDLAKTADAAQISRVFDAVRYTWWTTVPQHLAQTILAPAFPTMSPSIEPAGRQSGWVVTLGIGQPSEWSLAQVIAWNNFTEAVLAARQQAEKVFFSVMSDPSIVLNVNSFVENKGRAERAERAENISLLDPEYAKQLRMNKKELDEYKKEKDKQRLESLGYHEDKCPCGGKSVPCIHGFTKKPKATDTDGCSCTFPQVCPDCQGTRRRMVRDEPCACGGVPPVCSICGGTGKKEAKFGLFSRTVPCDCQTNPPVCEMCGGSGSIQKTWSGRWLEVD